MFQSFSGNSRRPRQVNLSGQDTNPFAASSWGGPTASGTQKTVAAAQQERQQRQQERERLNATKRIQRVWRGHKSRRDLASERREVWDSMEKKCIKESSHNSSSLSEELRLLLAFFNYREPQDVQRLLRISERILEAGDEGKLVEQDIRHQFLGLARAILATLAHYSNIFEFSLLLLLTKIVDSETYVATKIASQYYKVLSSMVDRPVETQQMNLLSNAIKSPLKRPAERQHGHTKAIQVYKAFALYFLTTPNLSERLGGLDEIAAIVDIDILSQAMVQENSIARLSDTPSDSRLWLLSQFINIHRIQQNSDQEANYLRALAVLLSDSANEIIGRIDGQEFQISQDAVEEEEDDIRQLAVLLPTFVREQLISLVNRESITGLLGKFDTGYIDASTPGDASLLASYALILLRIFPTLGEEIRMWLYQGSITITGSGAQIPAVKLFWQAMKSTATFSAISNDAKSALNVLRPWSRRGNSSRTSQEELTMEREWRAILLFLELYAFVLRFTDDEEFLSGGVPSITEPHIPPSRSRESALPLQDVKSLTVFLKNLSFTMYYNAADLKETVRPVETVLGTYFGTNAPRTNFTQRSEIATGEDNIRVSDGDQGFLGISGMTYEYVRGIVTRVMRMLYERDSRRRFLPKDHWLMTSRFDMEGFIPAVVAEEERRNEIVMEGDDAGDDNDQDLIESNARGSMGRLARLEGLRRQQRKTAHRNVLAAIGPRLEVLQNMPFVIPFKTRVQIFRQFVYQDQVRRRNGDVDPDQWRMSLVHSLSGNPNIREIVGRHHAKIRRSDVFDDAFDQFYSLGEGLKEPIQITFVDQFDTVEAGIDGGGVTKEFLTSVTNEAFRNPDGWPSKMFVTNDQNLLYPNPSALDERKEILRQTGVTEADSDWTDLVSDLLRRFEFLGRVIGKCLYEGILVDIGFAGFFLLKWASTDKAGTSSQDSRYLTNINDLRDLDESLYQGLLQLKNYPGNVEDFSLDFTITDTISLPNEPTKTITRELISNGSNIPVTNENRVLYVSGVARHRLHSQPFLQTRAFLRGLSQIINPSWLSMFNQAELQTLIGGDSSEIDVDDLRRNTNYSGVYVIGDDGLEHPTIQIFWQVMKELDDAERRKVLGYVTSTPRAPLLGFGQLNPRFSIRDAGSDEQRLPSTSTCINLLKMPRYTSADTLRSKLVYAVNSGAGFDLS